MATLAIEEETADNASFRRVLYTDELQQVVVMCLLPGEAIGREVHAATSQFLRVEQGEGVAVLDGVEHDVVEGDAVLVPAGVEHNVRNTGTEPLKLYTVYSGEVLHGEDEVVERPRRRRN